MISPKEIKRVAKRLNALVKAAEKKEKVRRCNGKQVIGIGKVYKCNTMLCLYEKKLCSSCLLNKFKLIAHYDSEDGEGLSPVYDEFDVVMALRKASGL